MEAGRLVIKIAGNVVRSRHPTRRYAHISTARLQHAIDLAELIGGIIGVQVFQQLVRIGKIDRFGRQRYFYPSGT
jgi:hypothetical protein